MPDRETPAPDFDLNHDGLINVLDLQILVNTILAGNGDASADFNQDGAVNVLDLQLLVNNILGFPELPPDAALIAGCRIFPADLNQLKSVPGNAFEVVVSGPIIR